MQKSEKKSNVDPDPAAASAPPPAQQTAAEICEVCFSDLVQPLEAEAQTDGNVSMTLRCPECHHVRVSECDWDEARRYGRQFAAAKADLRLMYNEFAGENFRDELDCFVLALHTDLIGPDDFQPFRYVA